MTKTEKEQALPMRILFPILFGFFVMGFVDVVGISTNYVKVDFNLSDTFANLLPMMVFVWFALFSVPTGVLMDKIGKNRTVQIAFGFTVLAMLIPLVWYSFATMLVAFAFLGIGNAMLQVALNPLVAQVVSPTKLTGTLSLGQFMKAVSSFLGPILAAVAAGTWGDWKLIFPIYLVTTLIASAWLWFSVPKDGGEESGRASFASTLALFKDAYIFKLFLGILFIVGVDVGLNTSIPKLLMANAGLSLADAGLGTSLYFAARTIGTFAGSFLLMKLSSARFFKYSIVLAIASFVIMLFVDDLMVLFAMIVLVGLACANIFSIIFSFALQYKPEAENSISALMIMGVSGGALILPLMGVLADWKGQIAGLALLLVCLFYLAWLAFTAKNK